MNLPTCGSDKETVLTEMRLARERDRRWRDGRAFSLVYYAGDEVDEVLREAYDLFHAENGLNPTAFPSLRKFESEAVAMVAGLLGGDADVVGNLTAGGTESIFSALLAAREWARKTKPELISPEVILPESAHPAFDKVAHYLGLHVVHTALGEDLCADLNSVEAAINQNTILLVGSAPSYPHGLVDPINGLGEIALKHGVLLHIDACVGGLFLPFARKLGYPVPDFDFSVPGVTSISADLHKYGYTAKGASSILFRNSALRRGIYFANVDWPGGIYASPGLAGTRPGGAIAAAWAVMKYLGEEGYLRLTGAVMDAADRIQKEIASMPDLHVIGNPVMGVMALASNTVNIYEVGDEMSQLGWHLDRQQKPACLHLTLSPIHARITEPFINDLHKAVGIVRRPSIRRQTRKMAVAALNTASKLLPESWLTRLTSLVPDLVGSKQDGLPQRSAAMYGIIESLPNRGDVKEMVIDLLEQMGKPNMNKE